MEVVVIVAVAEAVLAVYWLTALNSHTHRPIFTVHQAVMNHTAVCGVTTFIVTIMYNKYFPL